MAGMGEHEEDPLAEAWGQLWVTGVNTAVRAPIITLIKLPSLFVQIKLPWLGRHKTSQSGSLGQKMGTAIPDILMVSSFFECVCVCVFVDRTTKALKLTIKFSLGGISWTGERVWYWIEYQQLIRGHLREKQREGRKLSRRKQVNYVFSKQTECDAREKGQQREGTRRKKPLPTEPKAALTPTYITSASFCTSFCPFPSILSSLVYSTSSHLHLTSMTGWFRLIGHFFSTSQWQNAFQSTSFIAFFSLLLVVYVFMLIRVDFILKMRSWVDSRNKYRNLPNLRFFLAQENRALWQMGGNSRLMRVWKRVRQLSRAVAWGGWMCLVNLTSATTSFITLSSLQK